MLNASVFEFPTGRSVFVQSQPFLGEVVDDFPAVPALAETLLAMELQLQEVSVDLREISETVLGDLGATIQVLRLAGREYGDGEDRPVRIEDCISDLGLYTCLNAEANGPMVRGARQRAVFDLWMHSREIAQFCKMLAEEAPALVNPQLAYLGGLLHGIGALPSVLGWAENSVAGDPAVAALRMAEQWSFPACLKDLFRELCISGSHPHWSRILRAAHSLAMDASDLCPLNDFAAHSAVRMQS